MRWFFPAAANPGMRYNTAEKARRNMASAHLSVVSLQPTARFAYLAGQLVRSGISKFPLPAVACGIFAAGRMRR